MKLVKLTSLTLAIAALVQGCANKEKQTENSLTEKNIKGDVKSIVEKEFSVKDYYGEITKLSETPDDITEYYFTHINNNTDPQPGNKVMFCLCESENCNKEDSCACNSGSNLASGAKAMMAMQVVWMVYRYAFSL